MANDSFEGKLFFGPDVLSEPDETESALRKEFDLMDLAAINVIFLRGCGVILLRLGDILDLLFDFAEHILEVREHGLVFGFLIIQIQSFIICLFNLVVYSSLTNKKVLLAIILQKGE